MEFHDPKEEKIVYIKKSSINKIMFAGALIGAGFALVITGIIGIMGFMPC